jgi:hypothetical protein
VRACAGVRALTLHVCFALPAVPRSCSGCTLSERLDAPPSLAAARAFFADFGARACAPSFAFALHRTLRADPRLT